MSFSLGSGVTDFAGDYIENFLIPAIAGADTINKGLVHIVEAKKRAYIPRLNMNYPYVPNAAMQTDSGNTFDYSSRTITPQNFDVYMEWNPRDLENTFESVRMQKALLNEPTPQVMQSIMVEVTMNRMFQYLDQGMWKSCLAYFGNVTDNARKQVQYFNGYLQRMLNDPAVNASTYNSGTAVTLNASAPGTLGCIGDVMTSLIKQAGSVNPALVTDPRHKDYMTFMVSASTGLLYQEFLRTGLTFKGLSTDEYSTSKWGGFKVEIVQGLTDNTIVFCKADTNLRNTNLLLGWNSVDDFNLRIAQIPGPSELWYMLGKFKIDVNYAWSEETFLYTTVNKSSFTAPAFTPALS